MTSEKNTIPASLATVKHGRCVQLATVPYDRARELIGDAYNAGTHGIGYSQQAMELHDAVITAQPSPGGQGSALLEQVARFLDYSTGHDPWPNIRRVYGDSWWEPVNKMRDELRALAAHPPVRIYGCCAQPEGELHTAECPNMRHLAARQRVGQITDTEIDARLNALYREITCSGQHNGGMSGVAWDRAVYRMASSQPAQAVAADGFWLAVDDDGFVHFGQSTDGGDRRGARENVESRINDWLDNDGRSVDLVWAGSAPAQAVDLDELRRAVCVVNVVGQIDGHDVVCRNSVLDVIDTRRQRLTDSKAVGNG
ncbi:hypothetical protein ORG27_01050 [Stenotrophomonas lactitubi]|uniref:hypothetical protein n=1 Tax=Stenotrophomonas lactitubi TaxID=2045214 RepID=UPI002248C228|nr:hypothetical protein [Stenotrophomonas lactitubi]MCX2892165.1 hypothetical protein [Stenotrophomonas lactitubi]